MSKKALILSGGSILGSFQAGAIKEVLNEGFKPDIIYGVSVGSLNGGFLTNEAGKYKDKKDIDWSKAGNDLVKFWQKRITKPSDLIKEKSWLKLGLDIARKKFDGTCSTKPLRNIVRTTFDEKYLRTSYVDYSATAVNILDGKLKHFDRNEPSLIDGIIASTAIPILMPRMDIDNSPYMDGGLRDVVPLKRVIKNHEATEIVVILCQSEQLNAAYYNPGNFMHMLPRLMDINTMEIVNEDISKMQYINQLIPEGEEKVKEGEHAGKRKIKYKIIRPQSELALKIDNFNKEDIQKLIELGERIAKEFEWRT